MSVRQLYHICTHIIRTSVDCNNNLTAEGVENTEEGVRPDF
jgi:hypothetical protein